MAKEASVKKLIVGVFEDFIFPASMLFVTLSLIAGFVVLNPWFMKIFPHSEALKYCLVMGGLASPVGMVLAFFHPNGNETWVASIKWRLMYFALNGLMMYMVMSLVTRVFDKEAQLYLLLGMVSNIILMLLLCSMYWLAAWKWNRG